MTFILPEQLEAGAVLPQCLDGQYVPPDVFEALMQPGKTFADSRVQEDRRAATNVEFLRSLLYGSQIVVNRAFLINNHFLTDFFASPQKKNSSRQSFAKLMRDRAIVPFLAGEASLDDPLPFNTSPEGTNALKRLLEEVGSDFRSVRLGDTNDEAKRNAAKLGADFTGYFTGHKVMNIESEEVRNIFTAMLRELRGKAEVSEPDVRSFKENFDRVADFIYNYKSPSGSVGRHELYAEFFAWGPEAVVAGDYRPPRDDMPFHRELKKLIDLRYNTVLPDALHRYCLTPAHLPTRSALQTAYRGEGVRLLNQTAQLEEVRREFMALSQKSLNFPRITDFTLAHVVEVRKLDAWGAFRDAQSDVLSQMDPLKSISFLPRYNEAVYAFQEALHAYHRTHVVRDPIQRRCSMTVRLVVRVAGFLIDLLPVAEPVKMLYHVGSEFAWDLVPERIREVTVNLVVDVFDSEGHVRNEEHSRQLQILHDDAQYTKAELREFLENLHNSKELIATLHDNASQAKK